MSRKGGDVFGSESFADGPIPELTARNLISLLDTIESSLKPFFLIDMPRSRDQTEAQKLEDPI
jgi:hypothetical protein